MTTYINENTDKDSPLVVNELVRYHAQTGWHIGLLVRIVKGQAIIQTPIAGQRNKKVPIQDVEVYKK